MDSKKQKFQTAKPSNEEMPAELQQEDIPFDLEPIPDNLDHQVGGRSKV